MSSATAREALSQTESTINVIVSNIHTMYRRLNIEVSTKNENLWGHFGFIDERVKKQSREREKNHRQVVMYLLIIMAQNKVCLFI